MGCAPHTSRIPIEILTTTYKNIIMIMFLYVVVKDVIRDSSVGIATRYEQDGPGIQSRRGRDFPHRSTLALGLTQTPVQWIRGLFPGDKAAKAWP